MVMKVSLAGCIRRMHRHCFPTDRGKGSTISIGAMFGEALVLAPPGRVLRVVCLSKRERHQGAESEQSKAGFHQETSERLYVVQARAPCSRNSMPIKRLQLTVQQMNSPLRSRQKLPEPQTTIATIRGARSSAFQLVMPGPQRRQSRSTVLFLRAPNKTRREPRLSSFANDIR